MKLTLHCDHTSRHAVHCNRYTTIQIGMDETPRHAISMVDWQLDDGNTYCREHANSEGGV